MNNHKVIFFKTQQHSLKANLSKLELSARKTLSQCHDKMCKKGVTDFLGKGVKHLVEV